MRPGAVPDGRSGGENSGQRRHRSDSTFYFKQRQWHAPRRGACHCQERIRQLVVFTPGSCPRQPAQTFRDSTRRARCERIHRYLYSFIHTEATPGNRLGSLVACCEQTAKKTPGICNFGLTSGNVEDERARHSAGQVYTGRGTSSRGLHARSGPPSQ